MQGRDDCSTAFLIVGPAWVGDMVMAQSLFKLLREKNPAAAIDVVAPAWSEPLLARMPEVRNTIALPLGHGQFGLATRYRIGRALRNTHYDQALVIPRSLKSAFIPFFAGVGRRTGFRGEMRFGLLNDVRKLDKTRLDQTVKRFISLAMPSNAALPEPPEPALEIDTENRDALASRLDTRSTPLVVLLPGAAYGPAKCWPIDYFGELAAGLAADGLRVVVLGSAAEQKIGAQISKRGGKGVLNWCGETRLTDTVDILSLAQVAVTNDSGLMHVAAAAGTHVAAIYGSTSPAFTPPLTKSKTIFDLDLDCSPCFERECPLKHFDCLRGISPARVLDGVRSALDSAPDQFSQ